MWEKIVRDCLELFILDVKDGVNRGDWRGGDRVGRAKKRRRFWSEIYNEIDLYFDINRLRLRRVGSCG